MKRQLIGTTFVALLLLSGFLIFSARATQQLPTWSKPRPTANRQFGDGLGNAASNDHASVSVSVDTGDYFINSSTANFDMLRLKVGVSATIRTGISYAEQLPYQYSWASVSGNVGLSGNDTGVWVDLQQTSEPFALLYWGVTYTRIWVCSNGFVSLSTADPLGTPCALPNNSTNSTIIAPFWKKLNLNAGGGSVTDGIVRSWQGENGLHDYFVVSWNNIRDANGNRQTFQLLIEIRQGYSSDWVHNKIFFQYGSITKDGSPFAVGVQDRTGLNGYSPSLSDVSNNSCFGVVANTGVGGNIGSRLTSLKINMTKTDSDPSDEAMGPEYLDLAGSNVRLNASNAGPRSGFWSTVIESGATTMLDLCKVTPVIGSLFTLYDIANAYASDYMVGAQGPITIANRSDAEASVQADCYNDSGGSTGYVFGQPFDASLNDLIQWRFYDLSPMQNHTLTITVTASYYDYNNPNNSGSLSTSVVLNMYPGYHYVDIRSNLQGTPPQETIGADIWVDGQRYLTPVSLIVPDGVHNITADSQICVNGQEYVFNVWSDSYSSPMRNDPIHADLPVNATYEPFYSLNIIVPTPPAWGYTSPGLGPYGFVGGTNVTVTAHPSQGYMLSSWWLDGLLYSTTNPVTVAMNSAHNLTCYFGLNGGGGDGCPDLLVWNGSFYQCYGIINIHNPTGEDVQREVSISKQDVGVSNYTAKLLLIEGWIGLNFSESEIDQVRLYAVDTNGNRYLCPLIKATQSRLGNVLLPLLFNDEWKVQSYLHETIELTFLTPYPTWLVQSYTFAIEGCNRYKQ